MNRDELYSKIFDSEIFTKWHFFRYHFNFYKSRYEHPFARALIDALLNIETRIPNFAFTIIERMARISGKEKYKPHYEQLLQLCSEIYVINQAVKFFKEKDVVFSFEPTSGKSKKNPEFTIANKEFTIGIEVKQPSLLKHIEERNRNPFQISSRAIGKISELFGEKVTLPRDNPVKDFLASADEKFSQFKRQKNFYSILFIVWDDFIYEPISALIAKPAGLFLEDSFAKDEAGKVLRFKNVDAVIIDRQLAQFMNAAGDFPLLHNAKDAMEYNEFPFKVILENPFGEKIPKVMRDCYKVVDWSPFLGAEYNPQDFVFWF